MATKWEKELITALLTSPYDLKAYRLKQRDKKHFDAYFYSIFKSYNKNVPLNIGLEFEYDNTIEYFIANREKILKEYKNKCVSLDISYDGYIKKRACENRLRINAKQFETLYEFLQDMYIHTHNNLGSIHIHIDCRYNNNIDKYNNNMCKYKLEKLYNLLKKTSCLYTLLPKLNESSYKHYLHELLRIIYIKNIKFDPTYKTTEYRWIKSSYNYTHVITNIIICSLLTQCMKHIGNKTNPNLESLIKKINLTLNIYTRLKYTKP